MRLRKAPGPASSPSVPAGVQDALSDSPELVSRIGAATVVIERRADTSPTNLLAYLLKNAATAKHRVPAHTPSGLKLATCPLRPASSVRQHEILSQIYLPELFLAGGDGLSIKAELESFIEDRVPIRSDAMTIEEAASFWNSSRQCHGQDQHYYPVAIDRTDTQLPIDSPISLAAARFARFVPKPRT